jgi:nitrite reductase (NADH) small subunit/3-phenylpropionate/trans-cinnamate dioxygenase ferredoxin subunit
MADYQPVCRVADLREGQGRVVRLGDKLIALFCVNGQYFAIDDVCPHMGASLSEGEISGGIVTCPWHGWRFHLADGTWADNPRVRIGSYSVCVIGDDVHVKGPEVRQP